MNLINPHVNGRAGNVKRFKARSSLRTIASWLMGPYGSTFKALCGRPKLLSHTSQGVSCIMNPVVSIDCNQGSEFIRIRIRISKQKASRHLRAQEEAHRFEFQKSKSYSRILYDCILSIALNPEDLRFNSKSFCTKSCTESLKQIKFRKCICRNCRSIWCHALNNVHV